MSECPVMSRSLLCAAALIGGIICAGAGWVVHDYASERVCKYTAKGYERFTAGAVLRTLPEYPLEDVSKDVIGEIQKCWAAHPYAGPQHSLVLADARKAPDGSYYLQFEPQGVSDIQLVFSVGADSRVTDAYQLSKQ